MSLSMQRKIGANKSFTKTASGFTIVIYQKNHSQEYSTSKQKQESFPFTNKRTDKK